MARNKEFFVFMYVLGMVSAICTAINSKGELHLYENAWTETFLGVYIVCTVLAFFPLKIRRVLRGLIYAVMYPLSLIDVYCYVKFDSAINPSILMLVGETDTREAGEFLDAYLGEDVIFSDVGWILLIALIHILWSVYRVAYSLPGFTKRFHLKSEGDAPGYSKCSLPGSFVHRMLALKSVRLVIEILVVFLLGYSIYASWDNYKNLCNLMSQKTIGDVEHKLTEKDRGDQYLPLYRFAFSVYSNRLAAQQIDVLREVETTVKVDSCSYTSPQIVLIIGEAYNKYHSQLYGYERPTTPRQLKMRRSGDLVSFDDVVSPWNLTSFVFKHIMSTYSVGDKGDWCDYPLFGEIFRKAGYRTSFLTDEFLPKAKQEVYDFSGGFFLNDPQLSKAQFDIRNENLHIFDDALIHDYKELVEPHEGHKAALDIFHLIGQHQTYRVRCPNSRKKFTLDDYADRTDLKVKKWKQNLCDYDNAVLFNDSVVWAITQIFKDKDAIIIYMPDHGEEVHSKELPHFSGRMHSTKITKRLAREEFGVPFWIYATKLYQKNHPQIWQEVKDAHTKKYMTDALPHLLMYLAGIHCKYYRDDLNILSPNYNEKRPRIIKHEVDYDEVVGR